MHALVIRSTLDDAELATTTLKEVGIPRLKGAPGFVGAQWVRLDENTGTSMLTFESEEAARGGEQMLRTNPPLGVTINSLEIGEVVARA